MTLGKKHRPTLATASLPSTEVYGSIATNLRPSAVLAALNTGLDPDSVGAFGETALHWSAILNHTELTRQLLRHKANPDVRDALGRTALDLARRHGSKAVEIILQEHMRTSQCKGR